MAWLFTGNRKYLGYVGRVLRFAVVVGLIMVLLVVVERVVLRWETTRDSSVNF